MNNKKNDSSYKTIGEVAKKLNLIDKKTGQSQTHTIRYWETQFRQIKPTIKAGGRRYYSNKNIKTISQIKFLLKEKGLTINVEIDSNLASSYMGDNLRIRQILLNLLMPLKNLFLTS